MIYPVDSLDSAFNVCVFKLDNQDQMNGKPIFIVYQSKAEGGGGGRGKTLGQKLAGVVEQGKFFRALCLK